MSIYRFVLNEVVAAATLFEMNDDIDGDDEDQQPYHQYQLENLN